jgi:Flp pilus assembly protein TadD
VNLNTIDRITKKTLKRLIAEQWRKQLPWVLAATLEVDDDGALWRNYFDAHAINQWLLNDRFQRNAGRVNPATGRPIITLDYFSINHADKEFKHLGTLAQLIKNDPPKVRLFLQASEGDNPVAINDLAVLLEQQGQTDEAETLYRIAVNLTHEDDSNYPRIINKLADLLKKQGKIDEAVALLYRKTIENGNPSAMNDLAFLLEKQGKIDEAETLYKMAVKKGNPSAMNNLAYLLENQDKIDEAKALYKMAVKKGNPSAMNNLAFLLKNQGKIDEAETLYRMAIKKDNPPAAMNNLARLLEQQNKIDEAETLYRMAIKKDNPPAAMNNLARLLEQQNKIDEAETLYRMAIKKDNPPAAMNNLARLLEQQNKIDEAIKWYKKAIDKGFIYSILHIIHLYASNLASDNISKDEIDTYITTINNPVHAHEMQEYKNNNEDRWPIVKTFLDTYGHDDELDESIPAAAKR